MCPTNVADSRLLGGGWLRATPTSLHLIQLLRERGGHRLATHLSPETAQTGFQSGTRQFSASRETQAGAVTAFRFNPRLAEATANRSVMSPHGPKTGGGAEEFRRTDNFSTLNVKRSTPSIRGWLWDGTFDSSAKSLREIDSGTVGPSKWSLGNLGILSATNHTGAPAVQR